MKFAQFMFGAWHFVSLRFEDAMWFAQGRRMYWRDKIDLLAVRAGLRVRKPQTSAVDDPAALEDLAAEIAAIAGEEPAE